MFAYLEDFSFSVFQAVFLSLCAPFIDEQSRALPEFELDPWQVCFQPPPPRAPQATREVIHPQRIFEVFS